MTTPASAKQLAAKLRAIEKANPGMKYRALFLSTIGDVAALESDGQVDALKAAINEEIKKWESKVTQDASIENLIANSSIGAFMWVLKWLDAAASEGS